MAKAVVQQDTPAFKARAYLDMEPRWTLCRDVRAGTERVRAADLDAAGTYLLKSPSETTDGYKDRIARAELFPAFEITVDGLVGIVFRKNPELQEDVPKLLVDHWENIDNSGTHGDVFARELMTDGMTDGHAAILVDYPPGPVDEKGEPVQLTIQQEEALGLRPYWVALRADDILSWRIAMMNGELVLKQLVIREVVEEPDGMFASAIQVRYKMFRLEDDGTISWKLWTSSQLEAWTPEVFDNPESSGTLRGPTRIPLAVVYCGKKLAPLHSVPPLLNLAYASLSHYNVLADRRYSLHLASCPLLVFKGRQRALKPNGEEDEVIIGPDIGIDLPSDQNADVFYVEHNGSALAASRNELEDTEGRMAMMGLAMLQRDTRGAETAEAKRIDKEDKQATLASAARSLQDAIELAMQYHAEYLKEPSGGSCLIDKQFDNAPMDPQLAKLLTDMVTAGQLSLETLWKILKAREVLPSDLDEIKELARIVESNNLPVPGSTQQQPPQNTPPQGGTE